MLKINKNSDTYKAIADIIASLIGIGASCLVNSLCNSIISTSDASGLKLGGLHAGKHGLELVTMYGVSTTARDEIDDVVDVINAVSEMTDDYVNKKNLNESN